MHLPCGWQLRHPNVISFLNSVEVEKEEGGVVKPTLYIITEPVAPLPDKLQELNLRGNQRSAIDPRFLLQVSWSRSLLQIPTPGFYSKPTLHVSTPGLYFMSSLQVHKLLLDQER